MEKIIPQHGGEKAAVSTPLCFVLSSAGVFIFLIFFFFDSSIMSVSQKLSVLT